MNNLPTVDLQKIFSVNDIDYVKRLRDSFDDSLELYQKKLEHYQNIINFCYMNIVQCEKFIKDHETDLESRCYQFYLLIKNEENNEVTYENYFARLIKDFEPMKVIQEMLMLLDEDRDNYLESSPINLNKMKIFLLQKHQSLNKLN
jgi:hypothetical protein